MQTHGIRLILAVTLLAVFAGFSDVCVQANEVVKKPNYGVTTLVAADMEIGCDRFRIAINSDGTFGELVTSRAAGLPENKNDHEENPRKKKKKSQPIFVIELQESVYTLEEGKRWTVELNSAVKKGDTFVFSDSDQQVRVSFIVRNKRDYITMQLVEVETPQGVHGTTLTYSRNKSGMRAFPLAAEVLQNRGELIFASLLKRSERTKLGSIALWYPENDEVDDEILYKVWVDEKLPHPKIDGEWTIERAKQWVSDYTAKFRRYSEIYITGETLDELKRCVDYAEKMNFSSVYMHLATWAGRYHTTEKDVYHLNEKLFPNGHADFKALCDYAGSKGIGVGMRTLSNSICLKSEQYIGKKPDRRLAHFWRGTLVKAIEANSDELVIMSDKTLPTSYGLKTTIKFLLIDDEIVMYQDHLYNEDGTITLKVLKKHIYYKDGTRSLKKELQRGYGPTIAVAHSEGAPVKILTGNFRNHVTADHDSELFDLVAQRYADFNNKMKLVTSSFDGQLLYLFHTKYGQTKFLGLVYSKLDHPTLAGTSGGPPQWGFFEIHFNSVKKAMGRNTPKSIPRMLLTMGLHKDTWPAPSPYGYTYAIVPNAVAGTSRCTIHNQNSLHDCNQHVLQNFGWKDEFASEITRWRAYGPTLPDPVKKRIFESYDGKYPIEHFRFENQGDNLLVVPFRPMRRKVGDRGWGFIQEHGPVYTHQYILPNTDGLVQAENPYTAQVPEFIIRVMKDFDRERLSGYAEKGEDDSDSLLYEIEEEKADDDKNVNRHGDIQEVSGNVNYRIMIPLESANAGEEKSDTVKKGKKRKGKDAFHPGNMVLDIKPNGAEISYNNDSAQQVTLSRKSHKWGGDLASYRVSTSIQNAKGLGIVITGDGSNALFVVRIFGKGNRDYVVPIDFKGKRYIEIPDPQVSWSDSRIALTSEYKRWKGHTVNSVAVGFASVPAKTEASVFVEDIRLLPEVNSALNNPVVHCGNGTISIKGTIASDRHIWYKGGDKAQIYDLNWNKLEDLPVVVRNAKVPSGRSDISIKNNNTSGTPWLEVQFFVKDKPIHTVKKK